MIDKTSSDMSCIYSTMKCVCKQASHNFKPVLTFDQPLYWKATMIVHQELATNDIKSIVLHFGGLQLEMSYLGAIGNIMTGSGLKEVLELIYAENAVEYIFGDKAIARGLHGPLKVDAVLNALLVSKTLNVPLLFQL